MKVLHLIDHLGLGGAQTLLLNTLLKSEHPAMTFVLRRSSKDRTKKNLIFSKSKSRWSIRPFFEILKITRRFETKIIHAHLIRSKTISLIIKLLLGSKIKLIFHEHGGINSWFYKLILKYFSDQIDIFIVVSTLQRKEMLNINTKILEKIVILPNAISISEPTEKEISAFKVKYKLREDAYKIGFVGRLHKVKGCENLIRSLRDLEFDFQLVVVGDGPERLKLEETAIETGIAENVVFAGRLCNPSVAYKNLDVLVMPSEAESFGLVALEAQTLGVPVIASGVSVRAFTSENTIILGDNKPHSIRNAILKLASSRILQEEMIREGFKNKLTYSVSEYIKRYDDIIGELSERT